MKTRISGILLVVAIVISTTVVAQKPTGPQNKKDGQEMTRQRMKHDVQKANFLTEEQKETMKKLRLETEKELKPLKNELREIMAHQKTLTTADNADLKAINKNIDKISGVKAEMAKIKAKQHQAFRSQLSEEQLIMFDNRKGKMRQGMKNQERRNRADGRGASMHRRGA